MSAFALVLQAALRGVAPILLPPDRVAQIADHLRELPEAFTRSFGFECRLHRDPRVDVQCGVARGSGGQRILAEDALPDTWRSEPGWRTIERFSRRWLDDGLLPIGGIVLAFDVDDASRPPVPWMHVRTERLSRGAIVPLVEWIRQRALPAAVARSAERCLDHGSPPTYLGLPITRGSDALRWTLAVPLDAALPFLDGVGWAGERERVVETLDAATVWTTHVGLSLDVGERVEPYLGLEFLNWAKPRAHLAAWRRCLADLTRWGLCTPEKVDALLAFPGIGHEGQAGWPEGFETNDEDRPHAVRALTRRLLHVKVSLPARSPASAKAYLRVQNGWIERPSALTVAA